MVTRWSRSTKLTYDGCGWEVKAGMVRVWVAGKTVEVFHDKALYKFMFTVLTYFTFTYNQKFED